MMENETADYLSRILARARAGNPSIRVYYYETWAHITSGTTTLDWTYSHTDASRTTLLYPNAGLLWRPRIAADAPMYERIVQNVNTQAPPQPGQYPVMLIPAGRVLASVSDAILGGRVPGFTQIAGSYDAATGNHLDGIFEDDIHLNTYGNLIVSLVHAAVVAGADPRRPDLSDLHDRYGRAYWTDPTWHNLRHPWRATGLQTIQQLVHQELEAHFQRLPAS